jgi:hypothetical protein
MAIPARSVTGLVIFDAIPIAAPDVMEVNASVITVYKDLIITLVALPTTWLTFWYALLITEPQTFIEMVDTSSSAVDVIFIVTFILAWLTF